MISEHNYLKDIPNSTQEYGFSKVLLVRSELIHLKHIFTELFCRKTVPLESMLDKLEMTVVDYMEFMTHRFRRITKFSRQFEVDDINNINKIRRNNFFSFLQLVSKLNTATVLDFDGVITKRYFQGCLYPLCFERSNKLIVCSANPLVNGGWFYENNLHLPNRIYPRKGKIKKIRQLMQICQQYDFTFFVDNESEYLDYAWIFGIQTFIYQNGKIVYYTRKTK